MLLEQDCYNLNFIYYLLIQRKEKIIMANTNTVDAKQVVKGVVTVVTTDASGSVISAQSFTAAQLTNLISQVDSQATARKADLTNWLNIANQ